MTPIEGTSWSPPRHDRVKDGKPFRCPSSPVIPTPTWGGMGCHLPKYGDGSKSEVGEGSVIPRARNHGPGFHQGHRGRGGDCTGGVL